MPRAPYKYLDYYTFEDADLFFGREEETHKMVGEILSTRLLVLFSPSGSGKTSLINAGVRPALEKLGYQTIYVRLDKDPIPSVQSAVAAALGLSGTEYANDDLHAFLQRAVSHQCAVISDHSSVTSNEPPAEAQRRSRSSGTTGNGQPTTDNQPLVIFIDQFEEFFIVFENQSKLRQQFIEQVAKIKYDDQLPVFLVFSLREDYFANLHEFREAIPSIFQNNANIRLEPFTEAEARRAIEEPVKVLGCDYEAGLVEQMLQDLKNGKSTIEPITLQIVCNAVWEEKSAQAHRLTFADYEAAGGADHILSNYVSCFLDHLSAWQQNLMAKIFAALKTPDNTKRYRSFSDLRETLKIGDNRLQAALTKLADFNLLRREELAGDHWYEFKHDYLVGGITDWIQQRNEKINHRKLIIYSTSPVIAIFLSLLGYLLYQYNTFYASFIKPEVIEFQQEEVVIFREFDPFGEVISTDFLREDVRDQNVANELWDKVQLGFWKRNDWSQLVEKLSLIEGGKFLYRIGQVQDGVDKLLAALEDQEREYKNIFDQESDIRIQTINMLVTLGKSDNRVLDVLLAAASTGWFRQSTVEAIKVLGNFDHSDARIINALLAVLEDERDESDYLRAEAANALGNLGQSDDRVINALFTTLKDTSLGVPEQAAIALGKLGQHDPRVINALLAALRDHAPGVRVQAAAALVTIGYRDGGVIDALIAVLKGYSSKYDQRIRAAVALGKLDYSEGRVIDALIAALKNYNSNVREQAAAALVNLGKSDDRVTLALVTALKDKHSSAEAAAALVNLGHSDDRVISALVAALKDQATDVRVQVAAVLGQLGHSDARVINTLRFALKDQLPDVRVQAAKVLGNFKKSDARAIDALLAALKDQVSDVRVQVTKALGSLGKSDARVIDALLAALKDQVQDVRIQAAEALVDLGQNDNCVIDTLLVALEDRSSLRSQAATALGNLGKSNDRVIETLIGAIETFDSDCQAVIALGNLGNSNERVIAALLAPLKTENYYSEVRSQAAVALGRLGQSDDRVISALVAALRDANDDVRSRAAAALGTLFKSKSQLDLLKLLTHNLSGYRTAGAQALARQDFISKNTMDEVDRLRNTDERPWVRLGAWEAYALIQERLKEEKRAARSLLQADSLFASDQWSVASGQYEKAFDILKDIIRVDSAKTAYAKFQQARFEAKLERNTALDDLEIAFKYNPTLRDTLQAEMAKTENDWKILEGNWYLREVLLKR